MSEEARCERPEAPSIPDKWMALLPAEQPAQEITPEKWSRRGRYGFILASALFFWALVLFAIRLL